MATLKQEKVGFLTCKKLKTVMLREPMSKDRTPQCNYEDPGKPQEPVVHRCPKDGAEGGDISELGPGPWTLSRRLKKLSKSLKLKQHNEIRVLQELSLAIGQRTNWDERKLVAREPMRKKSGGNNGSAGATALGKKQMTVARNVRPVNGGNGYWLVT